MGVPGGTLGLGEVLWMWLEGCSAGQKEEGSSEWRCHRARHCGGLGEKVFLT